MKNRAELFHNTAYFRIKVKNKIVKFIDLIFVRDSKDKNLIMKWSF